jgi:hypothetical protein
MQICSFLPSDTEILYALGPGNSVAGHEPCPRSELGGSRPRRKPIFLSRGGPLSDRYPETGSNQAGPDSHTGVCFGWVSILDKEALREVPHIPENVVPVPFW